MIWDCVAEITPTAPRHQRAICNRHSAILKSAIADRQSRIGVRHEAEDSLCLSGMRRAVFEVAGALCRVWRVELAGRGASPPGGGGRRVGRAALLAGVQDRAAALLRDRYGRRPT